MKKFYFLAAGLMLMLGSCSQDDVVDVNRDGDEIRFTAVTNGSTRAADIYSPTALPESFQVSAMSQGKVYISDDKIERKAKLRIRGRIALVRVIGRRMPLTSMLT
jgi:hypothetical protein